MSTTITALSTAPQAAGIHVIRMSGDESVEILKRVFKPAKDVDTFEHARMYFGRVIDNGVALDEVYAVSFYKPASYTGENVVEIQCHGSQLLSKRILELLIKNGAVPAQPGEFTKRAFLNGKIDLVQAEAVMDLLNASGNAASKNAFEQLSGELSAKINELKEIFVFVMANIDADIDFPEADIEVVDRNMLINELLRAQKKVKAMLSTVSEGRIIKDGIKVAICGLPNAGKSSLLNYMTGSDRAIVTEIPGTTRDIIEEALTVNGVLVRLFDTAGLRDTVDKVESIGIERTKNIIENSDIALVLLDGTSRDLNEENMALLNMTTDKKRIVAVNKSDLDVSADFLNALEKIEPDYMVISAQTGDGIDELKERIYNEALGNTTGETNCITNARQIYCLRQCSRALDDALEDMKNSEPLDIAGINIREAYQDILELVGETISDEITDKIFMSFCLGK